MPRTEQFDQLKHSRVLSYRVRFEYRCGTKRQQSDHGANLQPHGIAVRKVKEVIEEAILGIPPLVMVDANSVHGIGNPYEMLKEAKSNLVINGIVFGQDQRDFQHAEAVKAIHAVPSAWSRCPPVGNGALRSNTPMLSRPRNPPAKTFRPSGSLLFTHQMKLAIKPW